MANCFNSSVIVEYSISFEEFRCRVWDRKIPFFNTTFSDETNSLHIPNPS